MSDAANEHTYVMDKIRKLTVENKLLVERIAELEKVELETVAKARKMFVVNARKFGYFDSVGHTIQELQSWEKALKEQGE